MKKLLLFSMMCLVALSMNAQKRCVVLDFQVGTNVTEEETDGISYSFRSNFQPTGYTKLEQTLISMTIKDLGYFRTDMTRQQIVKVGRELEANIIVVGTLNKFMDEYSVDMLVIDVAKGTTTVNESTTFQKSSYRDAMGRLAKKLALRLRGGSASASSTETTTDYTDLGLPSGTLWKNSNATGFFSYDEAVSYYGDQLPSKRQWLELKSECQWSWMGNAYKITGPNGNSIVLPAAGHRYCEDGVGVEFVGTDGYYWSSAPDGSEHAWFLHFISSDVYMEKGHQCNGNSVRLVQD